MAEKIQLEVVTPERRVLAEPVDMVTVPGLGGELGILPGHTPLISQLQTGVLTYVQDGKSSQMHVSGGFVEVRDDHVSVLAEVASDRMRSTPRVQKVSRDKLEKQLNGWSGSKRTSKSRRPSWIVRWCASNWLHDSHRILATKRHKKHKWFS